MYEIKHAVAKGLGMFAKTSIPRGTRILAEKPVFTVKSESDVFKAFRYLGEGEQREFKQLSVNPAGRSNVLGWATAAWHAARSLLAGTENGDPSDTKARNRPPPYAKSIMEFPSVLNIFRNNNFDVGKDKQAVFRDICRINHACVPNAQGNFNTSLGRFTVHALRRIDQDEEITLSYLAEHGASRDSRQNRLSGHYGFPCDCAACDITTDRGRMGEKARQNMQARLHAYAEQAGEREEPDHVAELEVMQDMIQMYETDGLAGRELATMCFAAAELAVKVGSRDVALRLSQKGLQLDEDAVGDDSPILVESRSRVKAMAIV
ncbi:hypothetical protein B0A50_00692 [Salinomyces thailandicus]|uniref:SET domain-containing protein n=1 Tax=Salinomyces thailandicus TaxID=706561 RepID=A0A4V5N5T5_9PEZI|nr:hypothetical protein B0A50_00692 [Salinomyces thailandica]